MGDNWWEGLDPEGCEPEEPEPEPEDLERKDPDLKTSLFRLSKDGKVEIIPMDQSTSYRELLDQSRILVDTLQSLSKIVREVRGEKSTEDPLSEEMKNLKKLIDQRIARTRYEKRHTVQVGNVLSGWTEFHKGEHLVVSQDVGCVGTIEGSTSECPCSTCRWRLSQAMQNGTMLQMACVQAGPKTGWLIPQLMLVPLNDVSMGHVLVRDWL